jgi:hypothetical protein
MAGLGGGGRSQERTILRSEFPDSRGSRFLDALKGENADFAQKFPDPRTALQSWVFCKGSAIFSADPGN